MSGGDGDRVLVVADGSLGSLTAAMLVRARSGDGGGELWVGGWVPGGGGGLCEAAGVAEVDRGAVELHAGLVPFSEVVSGVGLGVGGGLGVVAGLVEAACAAERLGCGLLVWGVSRGDDLDGLHEATGIAGGVNGALVAGGGRVRVELPLVDLGVERVRELAVELGVPRELCGGAADGG